MYVCVCLYLFLMLNGVQDIWWGFMENIYVRYIFNSLNHIFILPVSYNINFITDTYADANLTSELKVILIFNAVTNYHKRMKNYVKNKL